MDDDAGPFAGMAPLVEHTRPLTMTVGMPTGYWNGSVKVARSATVAGSKITRSAASPSLISPRSTMCSCEAVRPLILCTACSSAMTCSSRTYLPRTRGKVPKLRGCGTPVRSGPLVASADPSEPIETQGCRIASLRSLSSMMNQTQLTLPPLAISISNTKS